MITFDLVFTALHLLGIFTCLAIIVTLAVLIGCLAVIIIKSIIESLFKNQKKIVEKNDAKIS